MRAYTIFLQDRGYNRRNQNHDNNRAQQRTADQAIAYSLVRYDQRYLATTYHANADLQAGAGTITTELTAKSAADDLRNDRHQDKNNGKQDDHCGHLRDLHTKTDAGKEHR